MTHTTDRSMRRVARFSLALLWSACGAVEVMAQAHEQQSGSYILRSSTVHSETLDATTARAHGIEPASRRAVLNVVVQRVGDDGRRHPVRADVQASRSDLYGVKQEIGMKETTYGGYVSYVGSYEFLPREVLDFRIVATPEGTREQISLSYRERMRAQ